MVIQEFVTTFRFAMRHEGYWAFLRRIRSIKKHLSEIGLLNKIYVVAGVTAAAAALLDLGFKAAKAIDNIGDLGDKLNMNAQEMQEWAFATSQAAVKLSSFELAYKQFARNVGDAATGKAPKMLARFTDLLGKGYSLKDKTGNIRPAQEVMLDVAEAFHKMTDAQKTAQLPFVLKTMGRAGEEMMQYLNLGKEKIHEMFLEARRSGHIISPEERKAADALIKRWDLLKFRLRGLGIELGVAVMPVFAAFVELLLKLVLWLKKGAEHITAFGRKMKEWGDSIGMSMRRLAFILGFMLLPVILSVGGAAVKMLGAMALGFLRLAAAQLIAIAPYAALLFALYLIGDEIYVLLAGGDTLVGALEKWFNKIDPKDNPLLNAFKAIGASLMDFMDMKKWERTWTSIADLMVTTVNWLTDKVLALAQLIVGFIPNIAGVDIGGMASGAIARFRNTFGKDSEIHRSDDVKNMKEAIDPANWYNKMLSGSVLGEPVGGNKNALSPVNQAIHATYDIKVSAAPGADSESISKAVVGGVRDYMEELRATYSAAH